jgi:hypothetical protein
MLAARLLTYDLREAVEAFSWDEIEIACLTVTRDTGLTGFKAIAEAHRRLWKREHDIEGKQQRIRRRGT